MNRGAWWATIHGVSKLDMTEQLSMHACIPKMKKILSFRRLRKSLKRGRKLIDEKSSTYLLVGVGNGFCKRNNTFQA